MTELSPELEAALKELEEVLAEEKASGQPPDTSWTDDLPEATRPEDDDEQVVTFVKKAH